MLNTVIPSPNWCHKSSRTHVWISFLIDNETFELWRNSFINNAAASVNGTCRGILMIQNSLSDLWYTKTPYAYLLLPFSKTYEIAIKTRRYLYKHRLKKSYKFNVPIIVIGNLTVGGTGKTPLTIWIAQLLKKQGFRPGIVSRGYGGKAWTYPQEVTEGSDPTIVGDEAILLRKYAECPTMVDPDRPAAVQELLEKYHCDIILSDDGLQHYALQRDIEIIVVDGDRRFGNRLCLPAGPLREPISRIRDVDFIVTNGSPAPNEFQLSLIPEKFHNVANSEKTKSIVEFAGQIVHAVAAIGNPNRFFQSLRSMGLTIVEHVYPDHHFFDPDEINFGNNALVVMTEKDAVKCKNFADEKHWYLSVMPEVESDFGQQLLQKLKSRVNIVQK